MELESAFMVPQNDLTPGSGIVICIPVYNDWPAVALLIQQLDAVAGSMADPCSLVLIDDGSADLPPAALASPPRFLRRVQVVQLRCNVGHQRAIALGLCFIQHSTEARLTVIMDGDGEDRPEDLPLLIARCKERGETCIVFAQRTTRTEGMTFQLGYRLYKFVHRVLVGRWVDVGNFSVVPRAVLERLVGVSAIWNHYAAAVYHARLPRDKVPLVRGKRLMGLSKMNFVSLVMHGMSSISVYGDIVGVRMLCLSAAFLLLALLGVLAVAWVRLFTELAIPGWATNAAGLLLVFCVNVVVLMIVFVQITLQSRNYASFLPLRDWHYYVAGQRTIHE